MVRRLVRYAVAVAAATLVLLAAALPAWADPGDLDPAFNGTGTVVNDFGGTSSIGQAVLVDPGNRVVAAGEASPAGRTDHDFGVARYLANGDPDTTFGGGDGRVLTDFDRGTDSVGDVLRQGDGKLVVVGRTCHADALDACDFAVARYRPNGARDLSFGDHGRVTVSFAGYRSERAYEADFGPGGTIVLAGEGDHGNQGDYDALFARLRKDGSLDPTFSGDGRVTVDPSNGGPDSVAGVEVLSDGRLVAAGWSYLGADERWCVLRLKPNGSLDPTFSGDGLSFKNVVPGGDDSASDVLVLPTGKILAAGQATNYVGEATQADAVLVRLNANGTIDTSFGDHGVRGKDFGGYEEIDRIVRDPSGRLVAAGNSGSGADFAVLRYHPNGTLDTSFGNGGLANPAGMSYSIDLAIADHERPVVAARSTVDSQTVMAVARLLA